MVDQDTRIKVLLGDGPERRAWESFVANYTEFHIVSSRYCLNEVLPEFCTVSYSKDTAVDQCVVLGGF